MNSNDKNQSAVLHLHRRKDDNVTSKSIEVPSSTTFTSSQDPEKPEKNQARSGQEAQNKNKDNGGQEGDDKADKDKKEDKQGDEAEDSSKKKMSPQKKWLLIVVAVIISILLVTGGVLYWLHARHYETTDDAFIDGHVSQVSPQANGRIQTLLIVDNQQVKAGQLLAEIDPRDYEERLGEAEAQLAQAEAQLSLQQANLGEAEANVAVAEADDFQAQQDLKRFQSVNPKAITSQQLDKAIAVAKSADAKLNSSHEAVEAAKAQIATAAANVQQADVDVSNAKLQLSYTKITSPIDGRITRRTVEVGNVVSAGTPLLAVVSNELWVTANYKETQLDHMRVGQPVRIKVDAFPDATFHGHVDSFQSGSGSVFSTLPAENATGNYVKVVQRVPVKIVFDDPQERDKYPLAPGFSVDPRVKVR